MTLHTSDADAMAAKIKRDALAPKPPIDSDPGTLRVLRGQLHAEWQRHLRLRDQFAAAVEDMHGPGGLRLRDELLPHPDYSLVEVTAPSEARTMSELHVALAAQLQAISDLEFRIDEVRRHRNDWGYRSAEERVCLLLSGVIIAFGSGAPPENFAPLLGAARETVAMGFRQPLNEMVEGHRRRQQEDAARAAAPVMSPAGSFARGYGPGGALTEAPARSLGRGNR